MKVKSWEEYKVECDSFAKEGITVLGFVGPWKGVSTKLVCKCDKHGEWESTSINKFKSGRSCPLCKKDNISSLARKNDELHVKEFINTGKFEQGTVFWRAEKTSYWNYTCPICSNDEYVKAGVCTGVFQSKGVHLKQGFRSCRCGKSYTPTQSEWEYRLNKELDKTHYNFIGWLDQKINSKSNFSYLCPEHGRQESKLTSFLSGCYCPECTRWPQKQAYIIRVKNIMGDTYIKLGISQDYQKRLKVLSSANSNLDLELLCVYEFKTVVDCRRAELKCKSTLICGVLNSEEFKCGNSEITYESNYNTIKKIYEDSGGLLLVDRQAN